MKVTEETQLKRLQFLSNEGFVLKQGYEWHHITEKFMVSQSSVEYWSDEEWDRFEDSFTYFTNND